MAIRLRRSYPDYINVPTLLIDVVSVMGEFKSILNYFFPIQTLPSVAFIPEGLPVAVTLSLAMVAHTLSKKRIVCK